MRCAQRPLAALPARRSEIPAGRICAAAASAAPAAEHAAAHLLLSALDCAATILSGRPEYSRTQVYPTGLAPHQQPHPASTKRLTDDLRA